MKHFIVGTAGHIDHGKSALVNALTGIDPDRLKEEKERGITIDIGFAHLKLDSGDVVSFIDVPGHEKLIKNMIAGAVGIDAVMLVIAANESVMPQTVEHLQICELLGIKRGFVAITKSDLVDEDDIEMVKMDSNELVKGTFLEQCEIIEVSSVDLTGIDKVINHLEQLKKQIEEKPKNKLLRMPVDRVFIMKGFGVVVTGTVFEGEVHKNQDIVLLPQNRRSRVKNIQVHGKEHDSAEAGQRAAINLAHVDKENIQRGNILTAPDTFVTTHLLEAELKIFNKYVSNLNRFKKLRFYHGTSENYCSVKLIEVKDSSNIFAQIELDNPDLLLVNDRFVLRTLSPLETIGGGIVLDLSEKKHRKKDYGEVNKKLEELKNMDLWEKPVFWISNSDANGIPVSILSGKTGLPAQILIEKYKNVSKFVFIQTNPPLFISNEKLVRLKADVLDSIKNYQLKNPFETGLSKSRLKSEFFAPINSEIFNYIIHELLSHKSIEAVDDYLKVSHLSFALAKEEKTLSDLILSTYEKSGFASPSWNEFKNNVDNKTLADKIMYYLINKKDIIKIDNEIYYHRNTVSQAQEKLISFLKDNSEIEVSQFKSLFDISRKYAIPLLEYFDKSGVTVRIDNKRKLRSG